MKIRNVKQILWLLIMITSIVGAFITKDGIYTKMNRNIAGGITIPSFTLPLVAIAAIYLVEQIRKRYPEIYATIMLVLVWLCLIGLIIGNT